MKGKAHDDSTKSKIAEAAKARPKACCIYCKLEIPVSNLKQWHDEKCKNFTTSRVI